MKNPCAENIQQAKCKTGERLTAYIQNGEDLIKILDEQGVYKYTSPSSHSVLGYDESYLIGKTIFQFVHLDDLQKIQELVVTLLAGDEVKATSFRFRHANGSWRWLNTVATNLLKNTAVGGIVTNSRDITEKKEKEAQHELIVTELTRTNSDLKQFSFIVSHNLRAPLSNIQGLLNLVNFDTLDKNNSEVIRLLASSANQLTQTINDIGNILILKNKVNISLNNINIKSVLNKVVQIFFGAENDITAAVTTDFKVEEIYYNEIYLESIFTNLISNAIKYLSPDRTLAINISTCKSEKGNTILKISDNGLGVDIVRNKDRIFGLYQRFHKDIDGVGLGLFIIKSQIEALRGKIEIESKINVGTTFSITFANYLLPENIVNSREH